MASFRFRKSIRIGKGMRLNVGAKSVGLSMGGKGMHLGVNSRRGAYISGGVPGTGLYAIQYAGQRARSRRTTSKPIVPVTTSGRTIFTKTGTGLVWLVVLDAIFLVCNWMFGFFAVALTVLWYFYIAKKSASYQPRQDLIAARRAYSNGDYAEAAAGFEKAYNYFKSDKALALLAASSYSQLHDYAKASVLAADYVAVHPEDVEMRKALARWYYECNFKMKALQTLQALNPEETKDSSTLLFTAGILEEKELYSAGIEVLKRAPLTKRTLTPDLVDVLYKLGILYDKAGDKRHAKAAFQRVFAYDASYKDVALRVNDYT